jgi:hypothetical protein
MVLAIGCRGFHLVWFRFSANLVLLRLNRRHFDNLQLVARKCSYVIWINRFNKNFNPTLRLSADGVSLTENSLLDDQVPSTLSKEVKQRISRNRNSAFLKLRASRNRTSALVKLRESRNRIAISRLRWFTELGRLHLSRFLLLLPLILQLLTQHL